MPRSIRGRHVLRSTEGNKVHACLRKRRAVCLTDLTMPYVSSVSELFEDYDCASLILYLQRPEEFPARIRCSAVLKMRN